MINLKKFALIAIVALFALNMSADNRENMTLGSTDKLYSDIFGEREIDLSSKAYVSDPDDVDDGILSPEETTPVGDGVWVMVGFAAAYLVYKNRRKLFSLR